MNEILAKAADLLAADPNDLYKSPFSLGKNGLCAVWAIDTAIFKDHTKSNNAKPALKALADSLGLSYLYPDTRSYHSPAAAIINWNDKPERTKDEVIAALRHAAEVTNDA